MLRVITRLRPIYRDLVKPRFIFTNKSFLFEREKDNPPLKDESSVFQAETDNEDSASNQNISGGEKVAESDSDLISTQESTNYDPDWYVYSEEDDLPIPQDAKSFTPRWLKSSQESSDEAYNASAIKPAELSQSLLQDFFTEQRASDFVCIDVSANCNWTNAMVIVQGQSLRHVRALSETTQRFLKACQPFDSSIPQALTLEGDANDEWIVLDAGKSILHFMTEKARETYQLEELWNNLHDRSSEITLKLSEASDADARMEILQQIKDNLVTTWSQNTTSGPIFDSERDLLRHLAR